VRKFLSMRILTVSLILILVIISAILIVGTIDDNENSDLMTDTASYSIARSNGTFVEIGSNGFIYEHDFINDARKATEDANIIFITEDKSTIKERQLIIKKDGSILVDEKGEYSGQLVGIVDDAVSGDISSNHIMIVTESGDLYAYGGNKYGELGINIDAEASKLIKVKDISGVKKVVCGEDYTFILTDTGEIFGCGKFLNQSFSIFNKYELGKKCLDIDCAIQTLIALDIDGNVYELGNESFTFMGGFTYSDFHKINWLDNILSIQASGQYGVALSNKGKISYWGTRTVGKASDETIHDTIRSLSDVKAVYSRQNHIFAIKNNKVIRITLSHN